MSLQMSVTLICDGCKKKLYIWAYSATEDALREIRFRCKQVIKETGVMTDARIRRQTRHLCPACADKV